MRTNRTNLFIKQTQCSQGFWPNSVVHYLNHLHMIFLQNMKHFNATIVRERKLKLSENWSPLKFIINPSNLAIKSCKGGG